MLGLFLGFVLVALAIRDEITCLFFLKNKVGSKHKAGRFLFPLYKDIHLFL